MLHCRQVTTSFFSPICWVMLVAITIAASCTVPRKYQANKPFVFKTNIEVQGNLKLSERQDLELRLANQLDDSLKTRVVSFAGIRKNLMRPAVFDTNYANRSVLFMNSLMISLGYTRAQIKWDSTLNKVGKQQRVIVNFTVMVGKNLKMDSIAYLLTDSALQQLVNENMSASILKKDRAYSQQLVAAELDRLIEVFKDHGYYKISREDLYAEVDTVLAGLINPGLDPFEQIALLGELQKRTENPTINVFIKQRTKEGSGHLKKYYIRNVSIYPDLQLFEDTTRGAFDTVQLRRIKVLSKEHKFKPSFLVRKTSLLPYHLYRQTDYYKTVNTFSQLGAWQQVNIELEAIDSMGVVDVSINLYPAKKLSLVVDLEATRNASDVVTAGNLFGLGLILGLRNRNLAKESIQSSTDIRGGIELGSKPNLVQTLQGSLAQNIYFNRFILPFKIKREGRLNSSRTILNFNTSYTDRKDFFTLGSINGSIGYEWSKKIDNQRVKKNRGWFYSPINIELVRLGIRDSLLQLFEKVPRLRSSFNDGFIISQNLVYYLFWTQTNKLTSLKLRAEECGALSGLIKYIDREAGLFRYIKFDADFRHLITFDKSAWAFRAFAGIGIPYGKRIDGTPETFLPFFKSYFGGGPNSMRAWQVRKIGIGSSIFMDTLKGGGYDRFGDIQLEGNIEYRFNVATIGGFKLKSALFTDIGNIWYRETDGSPEQEGAAFKFSRLYKDIAVAGGTSLRFDFNYFLVRFDWAYKLKNPLYSSINSGWFQNISLGSGQLQLGINYPF